MLFWNKKKKKRKATKKKKQKKSNKKKSIKLLSVLKVILVLLFVLAITGFGAWTWSETDKGQVSMLQLGFDRYHGDVRRNIDNSLSDLLAGYGSNTEAEYYMVADNDSISCFTVTIPEELSFWEAALAIQNQVSEVGGRLIWSERLERPSTKRYKQSTEKRALEVTRLDLGAKGRATHTLILCPEEAKPVEVSWQSLSDLDTIEDLIGPSEQPTIALVIDDWGYYENQRTKTLLSLNIPFTMAIIPGQSFSRRFALSGTELALPEYACKGGTLKQRLDLGCPVRFSLSGSKRKLKNKRREIILHLPMAPFDGSLNAGKDPITTEMTGQEIGVILDEALASLPGIAGINNHMGSKFTSDEAAMRRLMKELKARDLFFLDSRTTRLSVAKDAAMVEGVPYLYNWTFLDQADSPASEVRRLLGQLERAAKKKNMVIGICHPLPETVAVLKEEIPKMVDRGIRFVTLSELFELQKIADKD